MGGVLDVTVGQLVEVWSQRSPDKLALVSGGRSLTFAELQQRVEYVAGALHRLGIARGDRVAVWLNNRQEWIELQFALARLGAILVTVNPALRSYELDSLLRQCQARALVYMAGTNCLDFVAEVGRLSYRPEFLLYVDSGVPTQALDYHALPSVPVDWPEISLDGCINMQYTSGTTGFPKGVRLTSRNIVNNGYWLNLSVMTIAYGLTEASPAITQAMLDDPMDLRTQTVGRVLPELEVEIRDPASRQPLGPGESGELCVRGYNVMQGYHDDPEATARAVDRDGWLATGDQASLCAGGMCASPVASRTSLFAAARTSRPRKWRTICAATQPCWMRPSTRFLTRGMAKKWRPPSVSGLGRAAGLRNCGSTAREC